MIYIIYEKISGEIRTIQSSWHTPILDNEPALDYIEVTEAPTDSRTSFIKNGLVHTRPMPPSRFHEWINDTWVENIDKKKDSYTENYRSVRNQLLEELDKIVSNPLRWEPLQNKQEYINYRQALLDVPQQEGFPLDIIWPTKPQGM